MKEEFLHYIWRNKKFPSLNLYTQQNQSLKIISFGQENRHSGPDFENCRIRLDDTIWAGNIEIHVRSSEWYRHNHHEDDAYSNVILHVVFENDKEVTDKFDNQIPVLELKSLIEPGLISKYEEIVSGTHWIPCYPLFHKVDGLRVNLWLDRLLVERLENKTNHIETLFEWNNQSWEETFYQIIARYFGQNVNSDAFEMLAKALPLKILVKHKSHLLQLEALLYGQSGMLSGIFTEPYPLELQKEYDFLRKKYGLTPLKKHIWRFMRMRPANFPTIRLAQFAMLIHQSNHLFSKILEAESLNEIRKLFLYGTSDYWIDHYRFGKITSNKPKTIGKNTLNLIMINVIVPFLFFYGQYKGSDELKEKALRYLEDIPPESNSTVKKWSALYPGIESAYQSQALLTLKSSYCDQIKCLSCQIGYSIIQKQ